MQAPRGRQEERSAMPVGRAALIASVGGQRGWADWANPEHRLRRLLAEFIGMAGLTLVLSGGAAVAVGAYILAWGTMGGPLRRRLGESGAELRARRGHR